MEQSERRRQRLARILDLAQTYRGWTRRDLARALRRDPTKLVPGSGIPKLDLVVDLANVLDWSVEDVVAFFWESSREEASEDATPEGDFEAMDQHLREAHREGQYTLMVKLARRAFDLAGDAEERARACNREAGGWDGLGRYQNAMRAVQKGLQQSPVSGEFRRMLQSNLANAYYSLWSLVEARAIAGDLLAWYEVKAPTTPRDVKTRAFAHYVSGHAYRRLISVEPDQAEVYGALARRDLLQAIEQYEAIADETGDDSFRGIASTCRGGLLEVDVTLGDLGVDEALARIGDRIDELEAADDAVVGDQLESFGWWCIFGCNLALRFLDDERSVQQQMAILTNKADEIAERLDSWAIRERVFTMEHMRWERAVGCTGFDIPCVVDEDDVRVITGTMARFPTFRETGWQILNSARVVGGE